MLDQWIMESEDVICLKKNQSIRYEVTISPDPVSEADLNAVEYCLDPVKVAIARFSDEEIQEMNHFELVELTKFARVFSSREMDSLRFTEHDGLARTAFLARRLCRQDVNDAYRRRGREVPYFKT